ncbi:MAG: hypothetical protein DDT32_02273 [Syntrophomonadaceae bacterium]|nr:hypothetical protein [Bacillota bacterium]
MRDEKGQAMVEAAIILPILIAITLAIMVFGFIINARLTVTSAAREGARQYAVLNNEIIVRNRVANVMNTLPWENGPDVFFDPTTDVTMREEGQNVRVNVIYRAPVIVPGLTVLLGGAVMDRHIILEGNAVHRREW